MLNARGSRRFVKFPENPSARTELLSNRILPPMKSSFSPILCTLVLAFAGVSQTARAVAVIGEMSFSYGGVTLMDSTLTATTIPAGTAIAALQFAANSSASVSFFATGGNYASAIHQNVVFKLSPYQLADTGLLWTAGDFEFHTLSAVSVNSGDAYRLYSTGFVRAAGFEDTPALWILTTQGSKETVTWTSNLVTVPEPSTPVIAIPAIWFLLRRKRTV